MIYLDKKHDPHKNEALINTFLKDAPKIKGVSGERDGLFNSSKKPVQIAVEKMTFGSFLKKIVSGIARVFLTSFEKDSIKTYDTLLDEQGRAYPEWLRLLDEEYQKLLASVNREVNVIEFGAVGDGKTDDTEAFKKAIGRGRVKVRIPEGHFITRGIRLPSWTILAGEGKGKTIIKLHDDAPKGTRLITNSHHRRGNRNIYVEGMSLDWNVERLGNVEKTATWGNHSSCLTYAHVTYGWVKNVEGINPGLHCFDVSSTLYDYSGDGFRALGGSKYIWLDQLNGYGFGDDGITTHHSDYIFISNSHMCDPSGRAHKKGFSNSNGIEVDDGSRFVWLVNNSSARCFGGVEIKAHHNSSAASDVQIIGHLSVNDNRSFNFRHIGHHKSTDPESKTAFNIRASNLVAIQPVFTCLYAGSTPRGMVVSAYRNVVINNSILVGDPDYDYEENPIIAIQYRARNVKLNNITLLNFKKAGADIKIFSGDNRADYVALQNITMINSSPGGIQFGKDIENIHLKNIKKISNYTMPKIKISPKSL
ncbi:glycosyl hydrolase family 28-related protein [Niallia endozanthoxylica]|uniref:Pectate lyase n=1 Tax=Niallia endozanthoxylica TaxID=2036016 RepID=A0A5J5HP99_9BACI|nr:glycosyl hydrolase family 28-related protein [Niallia endozanthoxylica]KAA9022948.1 pectate lyase [Niallia endozanthoxylica]